MLNHISENRDYLRYIQEIRSYKLLSPDKERELAAESKKGNSEASTELINANLRFVVKIALQYKSYGFHILDIIQEGNMGLMQAVKRYDPDKGYRLVTYAVHWIRAYIRAYILRHWSLVRVGTTHAERRLFYSIPKGRKEIFPYLDGKNPKEVLKALAIHLDATEEEVSRTENRIYGRDLSLSSPIKSTDGDHTLEDLFADDINKRQDEKLMQMSEAGEIRREINSAIDELDKREQHIIRRRYLNSKKVTLQEIGDELGLSRERVRQIESSARERLGELILEKSPQLLENA